MHTRLLATFVLSVGCVPRGAVHDPSVSGATPKNQRAPSRARAVRIDSARMLQLVAALADDRLGGRFSLTHDDIEAAAELLAQAYGSGNVAPVGEAYRHPYAHETSVYETAPTSLTIAGGDGTAATVSTTPELNSGSGTATGEVVFVGYAVHGHSATHESAEYDDLEGIDLRGKIALCLLDAPRLTDQDQGALFYALTPRVNEFDKTTEEARANKDLAKLWRAHVALRKDIARMVAPRMRGRRLPKSFTTPPEDLVAPVGAVAFVKEIIAASDALPGPTLDGNDSLVATKVKRLTEAGAAAVILVRGPASFFDAKAREADVLPTLPERSLSISPADIPVVHMRWHEADRLFRIGKRKLSEMQARIDARQKPHSAPLAGMTATVNVALATGTTELPNVVAQIPGRELVGEIVLIGAHFDHVGRVGHGQCPRTGDDEVCNGADDNASGTAMVVEVARALVAAGVKPQRTLVFANFSGEELGLWGSKAFAASPPQHPPFANGKIVAMINLDMVGRMGEQGLAIVGIGSSPAWMPLLDEVGTRGLGVVYERAIFGRSDHASFYEKGIPVLFFFTQLHSDYHWPSDEFEALNTTAMTSVAQIVADLTLRLADGVQVPFSKPRSEEEGLDTGLPGKNPATIEKRVGLPEPEAAESGDSPAAHAP